MNSLNQVLIGKVFVVYLVRSSQSNVKDSNSQCDCLPVNHQTVKLESPFGGPYIIAIFAIFDNMAKTAKLTTRLTVKKTASLNTRLEILLKVFTISNTHPNRTPPHNHAHQLI